MYDFSFHLDEYVYLAIKMMEVDPQLGRLRNKLVPKKYNFIENIKKQYFSRLPENDFWKNYFYHIEVIKYKYNMINKIKMLGEIQTQPEAALITIDQSTKSQDKDI